MGNVTPLISIEGLKDESDIRRGKDGVLDRTICGVRACRKARLIFGVAASICRSNYEDLVSRAHIERMAREGALYLWYYIYRPVGAVPNVENALTKEQIRDFRRFIVEQRRDAPLFIIDTYWDDKGKALCPAATGMSHHISPSGAVEFARLYRWLGTLLMGMPQTWWSYSVIQGFGGSAENDSRDIQGLYPFGRSRKNVEILGTTGCDRYYDSGYGKGGISENEPGSRS